MVHSAYSPAPRSNAARFDSGLSRSGFQRVYRRPLCRGTGNFTSRESVPPGGCHVAPGCAPIRYEHLCRLPRLPSPLDELSGVSLCRLSSPLRRSPPSQPSRANPPPSALNPRRDPGPKPGSRRQRLRPKPGRRAGLGRIRSPGERRLRYAEHGKPTLPRSSWLCPAPHRCQLDCEFPLRNRVVPR